MFKHVGSRFISDIFNIFFSLIYYWQLMAPQNTQKKIVVLLLYFRYLSIATGEVVGGVPSTNRARSVRLEGKNPS